MTIEQAQKDSGLLKLSVSKTNTFLQCKAKYKFSYILKLPKKEYAYHLFGRFVHRILELFHLSYINGSDKSYEVVMGDAFNESLSEFKGKISLDNKNEAFQIISNYLKRINTHKNEVSSVLAVEKNFNLSINEQLTLTGTIDRVQYDSDDIYHIIDYKTSKSAEYLKNDTLQLLTYAYILYMENPEIKKIRVSYMMLKMNCDLITKEFSLDEILSVKDIYEKYAEQITTETEFKTNPQKLCLYCDFINVCEDGKKIAAKEFKHGAIKKW